MPSASSAPSGSSQPSSAPSLAPTTSFTPTVDCSVDQDGFYGSSETGSTVIVVFNYELELSAGASAADVLSDLEREMTDYIVPILFTDSCSENAIPSNNSTSNVSGISAGPDDVVLDIICSQIGENNTCQVIGGAITIFVTGDDEESAAQAVLEILEDAMENDEFLDANEGIERVTFVDIEPNAPNSERAVDDPAPNGEGGGRNFPIIFGIVGGVATLLIILAAFVWRKKQKEDDEEGTAAGGPSDA